MEEEVMKLQKEVAFLEKRIEVLEKREIRRKLTAYAKSFIISLVVAAASYLLWLGYRYVTDKINNIPNMLEEKIKEINPVDTISGIFKK